MRDFSAFRYIFMRDFLAPYYIFMRDFSVQHYTFMRDFPINATENRQKRVGKKATDNERNRPTNRDYTQ